MQVIDIYLFRVRFRKYGFETAQFQFHQQPEDDQDEQCNGRRHTRRDQRLRHSRRVNRVKHKYHPYCDKDNFKHKTQSKETEEEYAALSVHDVHGHLAHYNEECASKIGK